MLTNNAKVEFVNRNDTANDPTRSRRPIADPSEMTNPITLLRRRSSNPDFTFWSDMGAWLVISIGYQLAAVVGMKSSRDVRVVKSSSAHIRRLHSGCDSKLSKKHSPALCCSTLGKVQCAALR